ncbi:MAG: ParB/RepB/Spo0J family partition protein [Oscillospiraceae bacterium]|nr:ParB/RepB/Spo0J family partition protein [Oscillospiraceae bacterium]
MPRQGQQFAVPTTKQNADLFSTQATRDNAAQEKIITLPPGEIDAFPDHPYQVRDDDAMQALVESVRANGVLTPAIVRQTDDGHYELVSGHRRKRACELVGVDLPVIIRNMTRDEAIVHMVESNFQRETVLPSEKAFAYKMRLGAMTRQGQRTSRPVGTKSRSDEILAEKSDDSARQIHRYIRLTALIPPLLQLVDDGTIAFRPAVELSYLRKEEQAALHEAIEAETATPSLAQAIKMKKFSQEDKLSAEVIQSIMQEQKPNQVEQLMKQQGAYHVLYQKQLQGTAV